MHMHMHMCMYVHVHVHVHVHAHVCAHVHVHVYTAAIPHVQLHSLTHPSHTRVHPPQVLALHALVRRGVNGLTYDTPLAALWPQLSAAKLGGTVADALSHRLGLAPPPADVLHSPTAMADLPARIAAVAATPPEARGAEAQGGERDGGVGAPRSSGLSYGWLLAGLVERITGRAYTEQLRDLVLSPLGLHGAIWAGHLPAAVTADAALVSTCFAAALKRLAPHTDAAPASPAPPDTPDAAPDATPDAPGLEGGLPSAAALAADVALNAAGVNALHGACVPGLGGFGSARGMCALLGKVAALAPQGAWDVRCGVEASPLFGERQWGLGVQRYERRGGMPPLLGLHSFGGSVVLFCPRTGLSVALLLNDCQLDYGVTRQVLELVCTELKLGHVSFLEHGLF
jgi:CubicO group peptidase (beta-lactamase class C family)